LNEFNGLTGLPEFPIKPGTPGGPLLPCWTEDKNKLKTNKQTTTTTKKTVFIIF